MKKTIFFIFIVFTFYSFAFSTVLISKLSGKVSVLTGNVWTQAKIGQKLNQNDL